jgi:hypothetical protein
MLRCVWKFGNLSGLMACLYTKLKHFCPSPCYWRDFSLKFTGNFPNLMYNVSEQDNTCSNSLPPFKGTSTEKQNTSPELKFHRLTLVNFLRQSVATTLTRDTFLTQKDAVDLHSVWVPYHAWERSGENTDPAINTKLSLHDVAIFNNRH